MRHPTLAYFTSRLTTWLMPFLLCLGLASCGGGNGGEAMPSNSPTPTTAAATILAAISQTSSAKPVVWNPGVLQVTVLQGSSQLSSIQLTVSERIDDASLFVVPEIAGLMQVSLLGQTVLNPGAPINVPMEFSVPATTAPGLYEGTVHVRSGARTVPATLKIQIQVVQGSSDQVVNQVTDPSPDRVGRMGMGQFLIRDELVVVLRGDVADPNSRIKEVARQVGTVIIGTVPGLPVYQLRIVGADISSLPTYADAARRLAGVESVSLNLLGAALKTPNDALFNNLWSTVASGRNRNLEFIRAPEAWDLTTGLTTDNKKQVVAVIDDDFDFKHADLVKNIAKPPPGDDLFTFSPSRQEGGHGTGVAGTLCAEGNNEFGVVGVAWHCSLLLYPAKAAWWDATKEVAKSRLTCLGSCFWLASLTRTLDSMKKAVDDGARVVNMSLGMVEANCKHRIVFPCTDPPRLDLARQANDVLKEGIKYSVDQGKQVLWVIAAGNEGRLAQAQSPASLKQHYPQYADRIIVVAAVDVKDGTTDDDPVEKWEDSNYGSLIDVSAPVAVTTTFPRFCDPYPTNCDDVTTVTDLPTPRVGSYIENFAGTSAASPQVAGVAILVLSKYPDKTAAEVRTCIVNAATAQVKLHAFKVINAVKAVECRVPVIQPGPGQGKDIWTTSVFSFAPSGGGPGGGLDDDVLIVGGWGDLYYSLIQFNLSDPTLPRQTTSAKLRLYSAGFPPFNPTPMTLRRITSFWDWRTQGTGSDRLRLWWADQPATIPVGSTTQRPSILPAPAPGAFYDIDVTDLYNFWQASPTENFGLELRPVLNNSERNRFFSSDYVINPALRPQLIIAP